MKKWKVSTKKGYSEVNADGVSYSENYCTLYVKNGSQRETIAVFPTEAVDSITEADSESENYGPNVTMI